MSIPLSKMEVSLVESISASSLSLIRFEKSPHLKLGWFMSLSPGNISKF